MEKWLHVFRIRCEQFEQAEMFVVDREKDAVVIDAFSAHPEAAIGGGSEWHIAGAERFSGNSVAFQIGRVQNVTNPQYDDRLQKFYEAEGERAPYAYGVFDGETQACVIEKKAGISAKASELAPKLEKLLNQPNIALDAGYRIVVDELRDPEGFIEQIRRAERVTRFSFVAQFENPHDVFKLIHQPAEKYNEVIGGDKTTVESRGENLDKEVVEEMSRSAASVGDSASATIKDVDSKIGRTIYLRGTPLLEKISVPENISNLKDAMLSALRAVYYRLRSGHD